jgi:hypothetical protein
MMHWLLKMSTAIGALLILTASMLMFDSQPSSKAAAQISKDAASTPVEDDMHEFMEYVFEPTYLRLKEQMAVEKKDRQVWKKIKSDALILAEGGNLTLMRGANDSPEWAKYCSSVRDLGGQLYQAGKKNDAEAARKHYTAMLVQCNACHKKFAGGKHQLKP